MKLVRTLLSTILALLPALPVAHAEGEKPRVRVAVLSFGTVNWELDTQVHHGLAARHGFELDVVHLGSKNATSVALQAEAADVIVTDWIWVSRQRAEGRDFVFVPHSVAAGHLVVAPDAGIESVADLRGRKLGIAGGPVDKSWLLLRAYQQRLSGDDPADLLEPVYGAPPLINQLMLRGELPAALNFWHYAARLEAAGMRRLVGVDDMLDALGFQAPLPLLGWVFREGWAQANPEAIDGFLRASHDAKRLLLESDAEWDRVRPLTKAESDEIFEVLKDAYRDGIPRDYTVGEEPARVFEILAAIGGERLTGGTRRLEPGVFWPWKP